MRSHFSRARAVLGFGLLVLVTGCSGGNERPLVGMNGHTGVIPQPSAETCEAGAERECGIKLDAREGVVTCYKGSQTCDNGGWGACLNGSITTKSVPLGAPPGGFRPLSLSNPVDCIENPCDPGCQVFDEEPTTPLITEPSSSSFDWQAGSLAGYPNGLVKKGLVEPCETGYDCQLNTYCSAPSAGSCDHSVCVAGTALEADCTACTTAVCAQDPTCCTEVVENDTCGHDPCAVGSRLSTGCNSCVTSICATRPSCCTGTWDATCVAAVATVCGNTCECDEGALHAGRCYEHLPTAQRFSNARTACDNLSDSGAWDVVAIDNATENTLVRTWGDANNIWLGINETTTDRWTWLSGSPSGTWNQTTRTPSTFYTNWLSTAEPGVDSCAIMDDGTSGKWNGKSCTDSYGALCEGPPERMVKAPRPPHTWSSACVALVASKCDAVCDATNPASTTASCMPWYPGETDPGCTGIDLAIGVSCDNLIPVCNHGQQQAPAGVRLVHFPANSQQYPLTNPDQSHPQMKTCVTTEPIPPGECISVTGCADLSGNREIMVNPGNGLAECSQQDNWGLYSGGECGAPICAGGSSSASIVKAPVDIIVSIDNSASMEGEIESVQARINDDLAAIIEASNIDYRVIMVSRYGNVHISSYDGGVASDSMFSVCIGSPLSSLSCPINASGTTPPVANTTRFFHHSTDIGSNNMWCRLLESYTASDSYPVPRTGWSATAPTGWGAFLRPEALKVFIGITDDNPLATSTTYVHGSRSNLARDCPNMLGNADHDGTNDSAGANDFDAALRTLAPTQFGALNAERNYVWYSIAGMTGPEDRPLTPADPVQTRCCRFDRGVDTTCQGSTGSRLDDAAGAGVGYQYLSILTGGLRYPSCYHDNFDGIFNAIADDVVQLASASCELVIAGEDEFDPSLSTVVYSTVNNAGNDVNTNLTQVASAADCRANAWYHDDSSGASTIVLCPATCDVVKADEDARVWAELACPSTAKEIVETFTYASACDADEGVVWLDLGYEGTIPDDATVGFRARVAANEASLPGATWKGLRTATNATASCALGSGCEIDVFGVLGQFDAKLPALELEITLTPSQDGDAVSLSSWNLTYSCGENQ